MKVKATTVVSFGSSDDYIFNCELDAKLNVDKDGKEVSSFTTSDIAHIIVNKSLNVNILDVVATDGAIVSTGGSSRSNKIQQLFSGRDKETEYTFEHASPSVNSKYFGRPSSILRKSDSNGITTYIGNKSHAPFVVEFTYNFPVRQYMVHPPNVVLEKDEEYTVYVVFYIEVM